MWRWSYDTFLNHPRISGVILVTSVDRIAEMQRWAPDACVVQGGATRQESAFQALQAALQPPFQAEALLIHDAARPFVSDSLIDRVIDGIEDAGAAGAAIAVTDTVKEISGGSVRTLDRSKLVAMQTPQGATPELLMEAHRRCDGSVTDDLAMLEAIGIVPRLVDGDVDNFKITNPMDLARAQAHLRDDSYSGPETRTGIGYDVHPFSDNPDRVLWLGGVSFPGHRALDGHSDADALLHALTDAILGAAGLGDIGQHFPNTEEKWRGKPSIIFLEYAVKLVESRGWNLVNVDMTCVAETPKLMKRESEIREVVSQALGTSPERVSLKATTNERLGFIGRSEGIAAMAIATIRRP